MYAASMDADCCHWKKLEHVPGGNPSNLGHAKGAFVVGASGGPALDRTRCCLRAGLSEELPRCCKQHDEKDSAIAPLTGIAPDWASSHEYPFKRDVPALVGATVRSR